MIKHVFGRVFLVIIAWFTVSLYSIAEDLTNCYNSNKISSLDDKIILLTDCINYGMLSVDNITYALINRGIIYGSKGQHDRAIADYNEAIRLKPDLGEAFNNRGIVYEGKGQHDRAIADYNEAIRLKPDYADAFNNRGNAYVGRGQHDRAIADYNEAIRLKQKQRP